MPTLLLDRHQCRRNIQGMASKAEKHGLAFRPHCKTHQSATIAGWYRDYGVDRITVSSFRMAHYFAIHGWKDILVAFPFSPADLDILHQLSALRRMGILLDNTDTLPFLDRSDHPVEVYVDVDTGYGRTGIPAEDLDSMEELIKGIRERSHLRFRGFYCHAGHSYKAPDKADKLAIHRKALADLKNLKKHFGQLQCRVLYGDTPLCSTMDDFSGIDEITPGNFVFYDLTQWQLGSCTLDQVAVAVACPVSGSYAGGKLLVHGGAVHFSKESLQLGGRTIFGQVVQPTVRGWGKAVDGAFLESLSQEHGLITDGGALHGQTRIGEQLLVLPVHSCLTANLMRSYRTIEGQQIESMNSTP